MEERTGKPSVIAAINGAIAGLAGITPASGYVSVESAFHYWHSGRYSILSWSTFAQRQTQN